MLLPSSHFCYPILQHLLTYMFLLHYHGLSYPAYFIQCSVSLQSLVPYWYLTFMIFFLLISVHGLASVHFLILTQFPFICHSVVNTKSFMPANRECGRNSEAF